MASFLPITTSDLIAWFAPGQKIFAQGSSTAIPGNSANVLAVPNRVNGQNAIQTISANQPTWSQNNLAGGISGLVFTGTQYLVYFLPANTVLTNAQPPITITFAFSSGVNSSTVFPVSAYWSGQGTNNRSQMGVKLGSTGILTAFRIDDAGVSDSAASTPAVLANTPYVCTMTYDSSQIKVRLNGVQIAQSLVSSGFGTIDTIVLGTGPKNQASAWSGGFNGTLGHVAIYYGDTSVVPVEKHMMAQLKLTAIDA